MRTVAEQKAFMPSLHAQIEEVLQPIFEHIVDPTKIDFEDDIVLIIKSFITKTK